MKISKTLNNYHNKNKGLKVDGVKLDKGKVARQDIERFAKLFVMNIPENKSLWTINRKRNKFLAALNELYELSNDDIKYFCRRVGIEMGLIVDISWEDYYKIEKEMRLG